MLKKIIRYLSFSVVGLVATWFLVALVLVFWPEPRFIRPATAATETVSTPRRVADRDEIGEDVSFSMRDGIVLHARHIASNSSLTVLFLHGVMGHAGKCLETCRMIHETTGAEVFALDLRGHGQSGGTPGDVTYIGQYENDVADVIAALRRRKPDGEIILAGHSMGGGIVLRYAAKRETPGADGYLLFAPLLGSQSPTARTEPAKGSMNEGETLMKLHIPRTIGLVMLNAAGIRVFNGRKTLFFNVPTQYPIHAYSFRAMAGMAPDNHLAALTADEKPLLVVVGQNDEAFHAERFASVVGIHRQGETVVIENEGHDGILRNSSALKGVGDWMTRRWPSAANQD